MNLSHQDKGGMAQEDQARRGAIKYGDVFDQMSGDLAGKPISPRDAAAMKSAENRAFGKTVKGGPAELMQSAASQNLHAGLVGPDDDSGAVPAAHQTDGKLSKDELPQEMEDIVTGNLHGEQPTSPRGAADTVGMATRLKEP